MQHKFTSINQSSTNNCLHDLNQTNLTQILDRDSLSQKKFIKRQLAKFASKLVKRINRKRKQMQKAESNSQHKQPSTNHYSYTNC